MIIFLLIVILIDCSQQLGLTYPKVARNESEKEIKFGIEISDPYRWLEKSDTKERTAFIEAQNKLTRSFLDTNKHRAEIKKGLTDLTNFEKYGLPSKHGNKYYYSYNTGLQNQEIIYQVDSMDDLTNAKVFLDPNKLSEDGTTFLSFTSFSPDAKWMVYGANEAGGDWVKFRIREVETGNELAETLIKIKFFQPSWSKDSRGFFYSYYDQYKGKPNSSDSGSPTNMKIFYHKLNTDQSKDIMIAKFPDHPNWLVRAVVSDDGKYLNIFASEGTFTTHWFYVTLDSNKPIEGPFTLKKVFSEPAEMINYVTNDGSTFYIHTNIDAPNHKVVSFDISNPIKSKWTTIIPEHNRDILDNAISVGGDYLAVHVLQDVTSKLRLHKLKDGSFLQNITLPLGSLSSVSGKRDQSEMFYSITSFLTPFEIYSFNLTKTPFENKLLKKSHVKGLDPTQFVSKQIFYPSKDGTKIPMFLIHKKGLKLTDDGINGSMVKHPAFLYGYGGFRFSALPFYDVLNTYFVQYLDGVLAIANLRGGGEYGDSWHKAGMLLNKQNVFDDFHWAAQYLIKNNYTTRDLLTIHGESNGGLLIGATANQRPDLYGCAIPSVGVMDMLRFHKFTIGYAWIPEYGDPDKEIYFKNLVKYSPLHTIPKSGRYPATLVTTADHDDRVVPAHSLKFISQLQHNLGEKLSNSTPFMIRVDTNSGHGSGISTTKEIEKNVDLISFIMNSLKIQKLNRSGLTFQ